MKEYLLGGIDPGLFGACFIAAIVGAFIVLWSGTGLRDKTSNSSPTHFSWSYLMSDNFKRIIANLLVIVVVLRFMPEILNTDLTMWKGLCVGVGSDGLFLLIKQKTSWLDPKPKE